jgi:glycosyltransferase involved in cell wall biosynthesis
VSFEISKDALFVGLGTTSVMWYRMALPAMKLGCDYVGVYDDPPRCHYATGIVQGESRMPSFLDYKVVVLQQPRGTGWLTLIRELQSRGIKVVFEVDDWLHAIKNQKDHDFRKDFDNRALSQLEMCMKAADAMIVSTPFLRNTYRHFNKQIFVCENGVDVKRYDLQLPSRQTINIGWAGATGHRNAVVPWLQAVARVMARRPDTRFVSIGQPFAEGFHAHFPEDRATAVPFCAIEQYPAAMTAMDIALGPAAHTGFYRGKSDLRWLEAGALGVPIVAHPLVYPKVRDGVDGMVAATPEQVEAKLMELLEDDGLRRVVGHNARSYVRRERAAEITSQRWAAVLEQVTTGSS